MVLLDNFFYRAIIVGIGIALITAPFGCFIVWRRMAYFGDTIAHSALLGVAFAFLLKLNVILGVFLISGFVAFSMLLLQTRKNLPSDAVLGMLSHASLALGLIAISIMTWVNIDLMSYLMGDILNVTVTDIVMTYTIGIIAVGLLCMIWRPLLADTASFELAQAEGLNPKRARIVFMFLIAAVIAITIEITGVLLITALLIIPAIAARQVSQSPEKMAVVAAIIGVSSVVSGMNASYYFDTPSGASIVIAAVILFIGSLLLGWRTSRL